MHGKYNVQEENSTEGINSSWDTAEETITYIEFLETIQDETQRKQKTINNK